MPPELTAADHVFRLSRIWQKWVFENFDSIGGMFILQTEKRKVPFEGWIDNGRWIVVYIQGSDIGWAISGSIILRLYKEGKPGSK